MLMISVMADTGSAIKLFSTMASAVTVPTETWLGSIKKYTAVAMMAVPAVMIAKSLIVFLIFIAFLPL